MNTYALLVNGEFKEFRNLREKPEDIAHKSITWHDTLFEYGEPFTGLENGVWVVRKVDPDTLPPPVPSYITRRQCALELHARGMITLQEALVMAKSAEVPIAIQKAFDKGIPAGELRVKAAIDFAAMNYYRDNPLLPMMGLTEPQIDEFFVAAAQR